MMPRRQEVHYKPTAQYICSADADLNHSTEVYVNVSNSDYNPLHYESKVGEPMAVSHKVTDTVDDYYLVKNDAYSIAKDKSDEYVIENTYDTISGQ